MPAPTYGEIWLAAMQQLRTRDYVDDTHGTVSNGIRERAMAAARAIPDDDPRAVQVLCEAGKSGFFAGDDSLALLRRAAAIATRRPVEQRYGSLLRETLRWSTDISIVRRGSPLDGRLKDAGAIVLDFEVKSHVSCTDADAAAMQLILHRHDSKALAELRAAVERELGADAPEVATLLDIENAACASLGDEARCSSRAHFERALELRERALGPDHPLTRASVLNLAVHRDRSGDRGAAEQLLARLTGSGIRDMATVLALRERAVPHVRRGKWKEAAGSLAEAARMGEEVLVGSRWVLDVREDLWLVHAYAAALAQDFAGAESAMRRIQAVRPCDGDRRCWTFEIAEVMRAAGKHEAALAEYDAFISAWLDQRDGISWIPYGGEWHEKIPALIAGHRGRAKVLARLGRHAEAGVERSRARLLIRRSYAALTDAEYRHGRGP